MTHELKTVNPHFESVWSGNKTFEIRKNDRDFKNRDILVLKEYFANTDTFSKREIMCLVTHILKEYEGLQDGYCIMSIMVISKSNGWVKKILEDE